MTESTIPTTILRVLDENGEDICEYNGLTAISYFNGCLVLTEGLRFALESISHAKAVPVINENSQETHVAFYGVGRKQLLIVVSLPNHLETDSFMMWKEAIEDHANACIEEQKQRYKNGVITSSEFEGRKHDILIWSKNAKYWQNTRGEKVIY